MKIDNLKCRVSIKGSTSKSAIKQGEGPVAPKLEYAQPEPMAQTPQASVASHPMQEEDVNVDRALKRADPRKVADRVYELMKREMADARNRGGAGRKR